MLPPRFRLTEFCALLELFCLKKIGYFSSDCWRYIGSMKKKLSSKSDPSVLLGALGNRSYRACPGMQFYESYSL